MKFSGLARVLCHGSLVALALLSVGFLAATVNAKPMSTSLLQGLPTRPPSSKPTPKPPASGPSSPAKPTPALPTPVPSPTPKPVPTVDLTFEELGHSTFQLSESGSRWIDLYLPRNFVPIYDGSYLDLIISHAPLEPDKLSVVKVTLNSAPLAVLTLSPENAEPTPYRLYLRNTPLTSGRNQLNISLDTGAVCNVRGARVDVSVYGNSSFHLEYSLTQHPPDLALYPIPFFERSFEYEPVYVVLPQNPSAADLSAAATIAAGLGRFSNGEIRLVSTLDTQISVDIRNNHHLIVVGKEGANRLLHQLDLPLHLDDPALSDEHGVIQELISPWNPLRTVLVVTGGSDEGISRASQALNRQAHLLDMQGPVAIVQTVLPPEPVENRQLDVDFTLADLGYEEEVVYGTRPHVLEYSFYVPLGCTCTEEARFTLHLGHARVASPTSSSLDVHFNDVPIHSILLNESNVSDGVLELSLPSWLIRSGRNEIRISIEMNLDNEDKCLFLDAKRLWTAIYSDSYFHLPSTSEDVEPSLDLFPYPFTKQPNLSGLLLILPDRPRQLDYDIMLKVAAGLGAVDQGGALALDVITADLVAQEDRQDKDLILIGRTSVHSLIAELNDWLSQPFEPGSDLLRSQIESALFVQGPSRDIGFIEELAAPWDSQRMILVLTGTTDEGVALAGTTLLSQGSVLAGNVILVEQSVGIRTFDTRSLPSTPGGRAGWAGASQTVLIQLSERWW
jgi:hypothetical protein